MLSREEVIAWADDEYASARWDQDAERVALCDELKRGYLAYLGLQEKMKEVGDCRAEFEKWHLNDAKYNDCDRVYEEAWDASWKACTATFTASQLLLKGEGESNSLASGSVPESAGTACDPSSGASVNSDGGSEETNEN